MSLVTEPEPLAVLQARTSRSRNVQVLKHRPALDGLRGFAVAACLLYQTFTSILTGAWIGVDMFLVLSGFFIASMLVREHREWGGIDYLEFLARRARRLLPTQLFMLGVVVVLSALFVTPARRTSVAKDVVASAFQTVNWRFILSDQSYFANLSMPTPVRHMWSLNVQEQFYVLFPILVVILFAVTRRRWVHMACFVGLAGLSVGRMVTLYVPGADPSRVYYGTDTRVFEVIVGVIAAFLISERSFAMGAGRRHLGWLDRFDGLVGWAGLASMVALVAMMFVVSEYSAFVFEGGLVLVCGLTLVAIVAASGPYPNVLQKILCWGPLRKVGIMGYSLYIWHWPVLVFSMAALAIWPIWLRHVVAMALTIVVGRWAYRHIEEPAHRRGLRAVLPGMPRLRKVFIVGLLPAVLVCALGIAHLPQPALALGRTGNVTLPVPAHVPGGVSRNIVILGNSVANSVFVARGPSTPDLNVGLVAKYGCDPFAREMVTSGRTIPPSTECLNYQSTWTTQIDPATKPYVVYFLPINLLADYREGGKVLSPGTPAYDALVVGALDEVRKKALARGASGFALNNLACHARTDFGTDPILTRSNEATAVKHLDAVAATWARSVGVPVFDTYSALCPGDRAATTLNGVELYVDTLHFSTRSAPIYWRWLAPQIRAAAEQ